MAKKLTTLALIWALLSGCMPRHAPVDEPVAAPSAESEAADPLLISKLRYVRDESTSWLLRTGFIGQNGAMPFRYEDTNTRRNRAGAANPIRPGEVFFADGPAQGRFKYLGFDQRRELNPAINIEENITIVLVEDLKPNKAGKVYEIPAPLKTRDRAKHVQHDRSAVLLFEVSRDGKRPFIVQEFTRFALPPFAESKNYLLKSVSPEQIVVEYTDSKNQLREVTIEKGSRPDLGQDP